MNDYTKEGLRYLRRASEVMPDIPACPLGVEQWVAGGIGGKQLDPDLIARWSAADNGGVKHDPDRVDDSILFFAFGIEKLLKGILYDVNPLFIYKNPELKNICGVLYRDRMTKGLRNAFDGSKNINRDVHAAGTSLSHAKHFSQVACNNTATLVALFIYRGVVAHCTPSGLESGAILFVQKHFSPTVEAFLAEQQLDSALVFKPGRRQVLQVLSEAIFVRDSFNSKMDDFVAAHKKLWEKNEHDATKVALAAAQTQIAEGANYGTERFPHPVKCPICGQTAILICEIEGEYMDGEVVNTGAFVSGMKCSYCEADVSGYEEVDYLQLDRLLYESA